MPFKTVTLWDGTQSTIESADADHLINAGRATPQTDESRATLANASVKHEENANTGPVAFFGNLANAASFGASGALTTNKAIVHGRLVDTGAADLQQAADDEHPFAAGAGELAGSFIPAEAVEHAAGAGLKAAVGKVGSRLAVGAIQGGIGVASHAAISGDPLTIEGAVEGVGLGAFLNFGIGALSDGFQSVAGRAKAGIADRAAKAKEAGDLVEKYKALQDAPPSWDEFREAHDSSQQSLRKQNRDIVRQTQEYADATRPEAIKGSLKTVEKARDEILARISDTQYGKAATAARDAADEAQKGYTASQRAYNKFVGSTTKYPATLGKFQDAIDELAERYNVPDPASTPAPQGAPAEPVADFMSALKAAAGKAQKFGDNKAYISSVFDNMPEGYKTQGLDEFKKVLGELHQRGDVALARADVPAAMDPDHVAASEYQHAGGQGNGGATFHFVDSTSLPEAAAPTAPAPAESVSPIAQEIKSYREQLSKASKLRAGGYDVSNPGKWTSDPNAAQSINDSMAELHDLRNKLSKYTHVKVPDLPEIPQVPEGFKLPSPVGDVSDVKALSEVAVDIDRTINQARGQLRTQDGAGAMATLRALEGRTVSKPGFGDLVLPELPGPPPPVVPFEDIRLPKTLRQFAGMTPEKVSRIASAVGSDTSGNSAASFQKVMADLGIASEATDPAELLQSTHQTLKGYVKSIEDMQTKAAAQAAGKAAAKNDSAGLLESIKKWSRRGIEYSAARAGDIGGWKGAITRTVAGGAAGYALDGVEGAMVGASLMQSKLNAQSKIRDAASMFLGPMGRGLGKVAPVVSLLGGAIVDGTPDKERNPRKQAVNRITEILNAKYSGPDAMFAALQPIMGMDGDVAFKLHQQVNRGVQYLAAMIPKDPGLDVMPNGSKWLPSHQQAVELAHRIEAVTKPMDAIKRAVAGQSNPAATEALWAVYPAMMSELAHETSMAIGHDKKITYEKGSALSALYRTPMTGLQAQPVVTAIQGLYLPKPDAAPASAPRRGGGAPGRPAAVTSPVAGSSVSALLH